MTPFYWEICRVFPDLNFETLYHENYPRLRFYFDKSGMSRKQVYKISTTVILEIFKNERRWIAWVTFYNYEMDQHFKKRTQCALEKRGLQDILYFPEKIAIEIEPDVIWRYYFWEVTLKQIHGINQAIIDADFAVNPILHLNCYYFWERQHIMIHLYDDRWMDIISDSLESLDIIFQNWNQHIYIEKRY